MRDRILDAWEPLANLPSEGRNEWLGDAALGVEFLKGHYRDESHILLFASGRYALAHAVLAPRANLTPPDKEDLQNSWVYRDDTWSIERSWSGGERETIYEVKLQPPMSHPGCKSLVGGEQLLFLRELSGVQKGPTPIEMSQKLIHSLDLHYLPERDAYCRLNDRGDIEDVVRIHRRKSGSDGHDLAAVTVNQYDLNKYMALTDTVLFVRFDFTRTSPGGFSSWSKERTEIDSGDAYYNACSMLGHASFANGYIIIRPNITHSELVEAFCRESQEASKQYASFKFYDRKNDRLVESPIGPGKHVSYFEKSDLPWDVSPAFFHPEVLSRFKADPDKYRLEERSISCRNAWSLQTYDINEAGQVHTYIIYLSRLPYEEQLYWRSFNEWPKANISERAHTTDILGDWDLEYDPLLSVKAFVSRLDAANLSWWSRRAQELHDEARYPATDSISEWGDELLALDHLLVEGFAKRGLVKIAQANGALIKSEWGSLKVLEVALAVSGMTDAGAKDSVAPIRELHLLRNPAKAHGDPDGKERAARDARTRFGSLRNHFRKLTGSCDVSLRKIANVLSDIPLDE